MSDDERGRRELEEIEQAMQELLRRKAAITAGARSVVVGGDVRDSVIVTGRVEGNVYVGPPIERAEEALAVYREVIAGMHGHVPLQGIDASASDASGRQVRMDLAAIYVELDTTASRTQAPDEVAEPVRRPRGDDDKTRRLRALEVLAENRCLVLLGDPGSGKTTFLSYVTLCLATARFERLSAWHGVNRLLPVPVVLRDFARFLPMNKQSGTPDLLWSFIASTLEEQNLEPASKPIHEMLQRGEALVLLDGLDEIAAEAQRAPVRDAVAAFMKRYGKSRFVVTCRSRSYDDKAFRLAEADSFTLAPFDDAKIDAFIRAWYIELVRRGDRSATEAAELTPALQQAVRRPDLAGLAPSPLLLTVMAIVHADRGRLPEARAKLYEEVIDVLLWRREEHKKTRHLKALFERAGLADIDVNKTLWQVAFEAHGAAPQGEQGPADIPEHKIEEAFYRIHPQKSRDWAHEVVEALRLRAGLLLERRPHVYTFPHRTFEEYLAGAHMAVQPGFAAQASGLLDDVGLWREVVLFGVGKLVQVVGDTERPLLLASELCPEEQDETEGGWRRASLAGEVLSEIGLHRIEGSKTGAVLLRRVQRRLVGLLEKSIFSPKERVSAGDVLARVGDPRFDPGLFGLPADEMLGFVEVPAGAFLMGSDTSRDSQAFDRELPQHTLTLDSYYIGRWPVTVEQFGIFLKSNGRAPIVPDSLRAPSNRPVVWVMWEEAMDYAAWLTENLTASARTPEPLATLLRTPDDHGRRWRVTLPSEAQWEKAARGPDGRVYPWGDSLDPSRANYSHEIRIGHPSTVGCFTGGMSPYGCEEMSGNVYEWTRSRWSKKDKSGAEMDFVYPYVVLDGREDVSHRSRADLYVVRGGSSFDGRGGVRCAYRNRLASAGGRVGFRVILSPFDSEP